MAVAEVTQCAYSSVYLAPESEDGPRPCPPSKGHRDPPARSRRTHRPRSSTADSHPVRNPPFTARKWAFRRIAPRALDRPFYLVRSGYPPRTLTLVPELSLSSLGLQAGEQIIVNQKVPTATTTSPPAPAPASRPPAPARQTAAPRSTGPASVPVSTGVLVHRVRRSSPASHVLLLTSFESGRSRRQLLSVLLDSAHL
jgi:hypothetical protein